MAHEIYAAMSAVMGEVGAVTKSKKNAAQGYQFRGIDDVMAHVQGVLAKHQVICVPFVQSVEREMLTTKSGGGMASVRAIIDHTFYAKDGSSVVARTIGEAMDSGDKASNKAMSAALKYALTEALMIPTYEVDRDTEESSPEVADPIAREVALIRAAAVTARKKADVDALTPRFNALPKPEQATLKPFLSGRKAELPE